MKVVENIIRALSTLISFLMVSCSNRVDPISEKGSIGAEIHFRLHSSGRELSKTVSHGNYEPVSNDIYTPCLRNFSAVVCNVNDADYRIYGRYDECSDYCMDCSEGWECDSYAIEVEDIPIGGRYSLRVLANCGEVDSFGSWTSRDMKIPYAGSVERDSENPVVPMYGASIIGVGFDSDTEYGSYTEIFLKRLMACISIGSVTVNIPDAPGAELKRIFISNAPDYIYMDSPLKAYQDQIFYSLGHSLHNSVSMRDSGGYVGGTDWGYIPGDGTYTADYSEMRSGFFQPLYVFPTDGMYSDLILSVIFGGTEYFYRADIPSLEANTLYTLSDITISGIGNPDPEFPSSIDVLSSFSVVPWSELATYDETF